eukprot:jgi/Ulvmu1/1535/UM011_0265.1
MDHSMGPCASTPSDEKWKLENYDVDELIGKIFLFFEAQESGTLRPAHRVSWRGDSYLHDGCKEGIDLAGGWHDAGDHLKLIFPLAWAVTQVAWAMHTGVETMKAGSFDNHTNWHWGTQTLLHGLEYLMKCHVDTATFVVQVGDVDADHGECLRAECDTITPRPILMVTPENPGCDMLFLASAAFASGSLALRHDPQYDEFADKCLQQASDLFEQGIQHPGVYSDSIPECQRTYKNDSWEQYAYYAAAWLHAVHGTDEHLQTAKMWQEKAVDKSYYPDYSWQSVYFGATALLWSQTLDPCFGEKLDYFAKSHLNSENGIQRTPCGMTFVSEWGSCRHAAGAAAVLAIYAKGLLKSNPEDEVASNVMDFGQRQICYILGACGHSWVIGYGKRPPKRPHHRDSSLLIEQSGDWESWNHNDSNPNPLVGGLCGGPLADGFWKDNRDDYKGNEVALDYNAALLLGTVMCL